MVARVGDKIWLTDARVGSLADARNEIARAIAGKARICNELVAGVSMVASEPSVTPANPQGLIGLDMSGPPWGSAHRHPVCWFGGRGTDSPGVQAPARHTGLRIPAGLFVRPAPWRVWVRPFEVHPPGYDAPYAELTATLRASVTSGTGTIQCTVQIAANEQVFDAGVRSFSLALTTTMTNFSIGGAGVVRVGGANWISLAIELGTTGGTAEVESFSLGVVNKRGS